MFTYLEIISPDIRLSLQIIRLLIRSDIGKRLSKMDTQKTYMKFLTLYEMSTKKSSIEINEKQFSIFFRVAIWPFAKN